MEKTQSSQNSTCTLRRCLGKLADGCFLLLCGWGGFNPAIRWFVVWVLFCVWFVFWRVLGCGRGEFTHKNTWKTPIVHVEGCRNLNQSHTKQSLFLIYFKGDVGRGFGVGCLAVKLKRL